MISPSITNGAINRKVRTQLCTVVEIIAGMIGDGIIELRKIRRLVENTGYDGCCEVEIFSAGNL